MAKCRNLGEAIQKVLSDAPEPMRAPVIWGEIVSRKLWKGGTSATPIQVVSAYLSNGIGGDKPLYERVDHGLYRLHPANKAAKKRRVKTQDSDTPEENRLIQAFGLSWGRGKFQRDSMPELWGKQDGGRRVNFGKRMGIYILYHFNKVVYVGRTTKRGIGTRLQEHTKDEHKNRWNRFSWFGVCQLDGVQLTQKSVIVDLESLLIEFADPPKNRKRGEAMEAIEYFQA